MGLSNYISSDADNEKTSNSLNSGLLSALGYGSGALIAILVYTINSDVQLGFKYSIITNIIALIVFGFIRGIIKKSSDENRNQPAAQSVGSGTIGMSVMKVLLVGTLAMFTTYTISSYIAYQKK